MRTINSNKDSSKDVEIFHDSVTGDLKGFAGYVSVYDSDIYIDTRDGTGYSSLIKKLEPLIFKLATKYFFRGNSFDDTRHDVIVYILEGILKYDPRKDMKLSSFLQMRINRRLINDLRNKSRNSKDANLLNARTFGIKCNCGHRFISAGEEEINNCPLCNAEKNSNWKIVPIISKEMNLSDYTYNYTSTNNLSSDLDNYDSAKSILGYKNKKSVDEEAIYHHDIKKWLSKEDPRVLKIVELIYFSDYTLTDAAKTVGLTTAGANIKLKALKRKKIVRELFGRNRS